MGKNINKRELIKREINESERWFSSNTDVGFASDKEYKQFQKELKKIVTEYVKTYPYDEDWDGSECVDDWDYFEECLKQEIFGVATFFKSLND